MVKSKLMTFGKQWIDKHKKPCDSKEHGMAWKIGELVKPLQKWPRATEVTE